MFCFVLMLVLSRERVSCSSRWRNKHTLYDVRTTTKSPNDAFLRTYPRRYATRIWTVCQQPVYLFQACKGCVGAVKCDCTGIKGLPGEVGVFGLRGSEGLPGDIGPEGPPGMKGEKGAAGEFGGHGEKGYRVSILQCCMVWAFVYRAVTLFSIGQWWPTLRNIVTPVMNKEGAQPTKYSRVIQDRNSMIISRWEVSELRRSVYRFDC